MCVSEHVWVVFNVRIENFLPHFILLNFSVKDFFCNYLRSPKLNIMSHKIMFLFVFVLFLLSSTAYSFQDPPEPNIPPPVGLPASINEKTLFLTISGVLLGFFILRKKKA
ncbi:hypothetical protein D3C86_1000700 [compost metagenome]